ncbi:zinc-binding dehydrogenase [Nakamurella deserti]|uniref:zinc-binding dehydrogenase n=1 Tax=Nakamurella deserti TaxID=2164074 RepID=UPI000DBE44E0|nr:alcohol dehydrogenase catalytic domain-containing protein [Nakamurella deserti]
MRAARFHTAHDIRIEDVPEPAISAPDELLLEVALCGICGTDLHEYTAGPIVTPVDPHPLTGATLPQILGHEFSARVREVGPAVRGARVGDRVSVMPAIVCGHCWACRHGKANLCSNFAATGLSAATGGLAPWAVVKDYQVAVLPAELTDEDGALVEPAAVAGYGLERARVEGGDTVLVTGAGPVGALSALYADAVGAGLVIIVEPNPRRAARARALDVGPVLDPSEDLDEAIAELTAGVGVDVVAECSGTSAGLGLAVRTTRPAGRIVQTGLHTRPATLDAMLLAQKDLDLYGSWCFRTTDWPRIIRMIARGSYPVRKVLTSVVALDDVVTQGFDALVDPAGDQLKVLVRPGDGAPERLSEAASARPPAGGAPAGTAVEERTSV